MSKLILPPNDELLRLLRAAYAAYDGALWAATPTQKFVWQHLGDRRRFVQEVAGHMDERTRVTLTIALNRQCALGLTEEAALTYAKRVAWRQFRD